MRMVSRAILALGVWLLGLMPTGAHALPPDLTCLATITGEGNRYVVRSLTAVRSCRDANLKVPGTCLGPAAPGVLEAIAERFLDRLADRCTLAPPGLSVLGFPGACFDPFPPDGFTFEDFSACMLTSHQAAVDRLLTLFYDAALPAGLPYAERNCQVAVARRGAQFADKLLRAVQKCRTSIRRGRIADVAPERCAVDHEPTRAAIAKAEKKARKLIDGRCTDAQADALGVCEPNAVTVNGAVDCLLGGIRRVIDDPDPTAPSDVIDYEFAARPPPVCGDGAVNRPDEECDGADDGACPGACGAVGGFFPAGYFPCLCMDRPRQRTIEHPGADLDLWTAGREHDADVVPGGGYLADLWDCDGPSGPDTVCAVGPTCSVPPHASCAPSPGQLVTGDSLCAAMGQGICRKTGAGATGPHCRTAFQQRCETNAGCPAGDVCVTTLHAPPQPLVSGGVSACLVNVFSEDVVGTTDLATGAGAVRLRERRFTHLGGAVTQPCPVCGGFCAGAPSIDAPHTRTRCTVDEDCPQPPHRCITDPVCSFGPNVDAPCRSAAPFGAGGAFGTTSVDCLPPASSNVSGAGVDVLQNPRITATVVLDAAVACSDADFAASRCLGGAADGHLCGSALDCPGGTCGPQCFCSGQPRPNACEAACVGGPDDATPCSSDGDCPGGICRPGDCRADPGDTDSCQEGHCTVGPIDGRCLSNRASCAADDDCPLGDVCELQPRQCFVNQHIERCGAPGLPARTTAAVGCVPGSGVSAVDAVVGAPGPGALTQVETPVTVGF